MALTKINASVIANNTIAVGNIADNSVDATKIASNSILTRHIDDDQITGDQLADNISIAGTLTSTGAFTSPGIDDNADAIAITIDSSENVGIGTTSPTKNLHISQTGSELLVEGTNNSLSSLIAGVSVKAPFYRKAGFTIYDESDNEDFFIGRPYGSTNSFDISNDGTSRLRINHLGNVGIGTSSPGTILDVVGDITATSTDTGSSAGPIINLVRDSSSPADADYIGQIKFKGEDDGGASTTYSKITGKIGDASNGSEDGIIEFAAQKAGSSTILARLSSTKLALLNSTELEAPVVDGENFKINGAQGSDGQLMTSTGSGVAWEDAPASGPSKGLAIAFSMIF